MAHWLVKSEPTAWSWDRQVAAGTTPWDGVRNPQATNNMKAMAEGDRAFFYHSNEGKEIVGIAKVVKEHYPDPTAEEGDWSVVDLAPVKPLKKSVTLDALKADAVLKDIPLVKQSRLSVSPLTEPQFKRVLALGEAR